jgi:hypothetical protein
MISCRTKGRLGNWMFQFAATFAHARIHDYEYQMPRRSMNEMLWPTPLFPNVRYGSPIPGRTYYEPAHHYTPLPKEDNLILDGYFQSEKYWHGLHNEIADLLDFPEEKKDFCAIHIRRGDYLHFPDQFPPLPVEYYQDAIVLMLRKGYEQFVFFSDDILWCSDVFGSKFTYVHGQPLMDMKEIYSAKAAIISNSTFSLFPALLDTHKEVIAPAEWRWYGRRNNLSTQDLMNEKWVKI